MITYYCPNTRAWWIVRGNERLYGPFNAEEIGLAAALWGASHSPA